MDITAEAIANRAETFKWTFLGYQLAIPMLHVPEFSDIWFDQLWRLTDPLNYVPPAQHDDFPITVSNRPTDRNKIYYAREVVKHMGVVRGEEMKAAVLPIIMITGATTIGDMIIKGGFSKRDEPLLQFARHLRNACAHGNAWHLKNGEPSSPAECAGFVVEATLQGEQAAFGTVGAWLYLEFLDQIRDYFKALPSS